MNVLVLFAHPVETSYNASLHSLVVDRLTARGHKVDDCDLYAEDFDPRLTRAERLNHYDPSNVEPVQMPASQCYSVSLSRGPMRASPLRPCNFFSLVPLVSILVMRIDTEEVDGSNPFGPTIIFNQLQHPCNVYPHTKPHSSLKSACFSRHSGPLVSPIHDRISRSASAELSGSALFAFSRRSLRCRVQG